MPKQNSTTYIGNPKLKKSGLKGSYTQEQVEEYMRCAEDPIYFIKHYVKIVNLDLGEVLFSLYPFQEKMIHTFRNNRFVILKLPRQVGKSITTVAYLLHTILFQADQNIAILANKFSTAQKLLGDLKKSYMSLPKWIQQGVVEWNKRNIELENGCKIVASSTSSDSIRGNSFNLIFLDEFAFVPSHVADDFFDSVYPTISSGKNTKIFIVSTPKGMNKFYKMWTEAGFKGSTNPDEKWNGFERFSIHWSDLPGRDEKFKAETIARTSLEQWRVEFECEFLGSSNTLISGEKLNCMVCKTPIARQKMPYSNEPLDIHMQPERNHRYVITVDVASGKGQDYSAFVVFDVTRMPYKVVAKYASNTIPPMLYADVLNFVGKLYNEAFILVELTNNEVSKTLHDDLEYENMISTTKGPYGIQISGGFSKSSEFGIHPNKQTKKIGCDNLKTLIEKNQLITEDFHIYGELTQFVQHSQSFAAEPGKHDDLVICLVHFSWLVNQQHFKDLTDMDIYNQLKHDYDKSIEDNFIFGFITNAFDSYDDSGDPKL